MKSLPHIYVLCMMLFCTSCVWKPITYDESTRESVAGAEAAFRAQDALEPFFSDAVAYAVFPTSVRAGTGFGGAYGIGWLVESGEVSGKVMLLEAFVGANLGAEVYRSILFFRTTQSLLKFKRGGFEFTGQAHGAVATMGAAITPSFNQNVAMFVQVKGGLLLEASIGTQRYDYFPLAAQGHE